MTTVTGTQTLSGQYIGGEWRPVEGREVFVSENPFDGSVFAEVSASTPQDARDAIAAAHAAQPAWAATPPGIKAALFLRAAEIVEERRAQIADTMQRESGSSVAMCGFQLEWSKALLKLAAGWVYEPQGSIVQSENAGTRTYLERRPVGVVATFGPWNGATLLSWRAVVAPLATGNGVVLKPSELSPVASGIQIAQVLEEAGFPPGIINVVAHRAEDAPAIVDEFYVDRRVRNIFFTGSAAMGRRIASKAAENLTRTVLELGGYNYSLVLPDADLDYAARAVAFSAFFHQGQICMGTRNVLVHDDVYDEFVERLVSVTRTLPAGDPTVPSTIVGPLINDKALQVALGRIQAAVAIGAKLVQGGTADGRVLQPTIITDAPPDADVSCEETFAPVLSVGRYSDLDHAIDQVKGSPYGLSFSVFTEDLAHGERIADQIDSGAVHVNSPSVDDEPHIPNGGMKDSGWGRSGRDGLDEFVELRWKSIDVVKRPLML